ncbi:MAG: flavodoxin-dependent (E)-4-hydroxy-3-methylbut-2-enyl-diphosphate synthase [Ruminococcaceae bacterium]|nr:flavodoxin-dependent (E)-4-hydroxy-3-methylbut-2-enyl-diphosphate synthase [Oscillospiraceae bacterium]
MIYNDIRRKSKEIRIGSLCIGGENPIAVQSMTNTVGYDELYRQMKSLENVGCDIIRMTVPDMESAEILKRLKGSDLKMPIVADIHFDWRLAIEAARSGADKIRINPGNIGDISRIKAVADACRERQIPIRVGVNGGSLDRTKLDKYGSPTAEALAESALENVKILEDLDFDSIVVAVKSSSPVKTAMANRIISKSCQYPMHLGVTEAGGGMMGVIKAGAGIGGMLTEGIGDTLRVSLTDAPEEEVRTGIAILKSLGFYNKPSVNIVSCPTCGRTRIDMIPIVKKLEKELEGIKVGRNITVAVMGCVVNGPGEAREADIGIAGGKGEGVLFCKGEIVGKVSEEMIIPTLIEGIKNIDKDS